MSIQRGLAVVSLVLAVLAAVPVMAPFPLLAVAVILLALAHLI